MVLANGDAFSIERIRYAPEALSPSCESAAAQLGQCCRYTSGSAAHRWAPSCVSELHLHTTNEWNPTSACSNRQEHNKQSEIASSEKEQVRENLSISIRIDLEVLSSFDLIIGTHTFDQECVSMCEVEEQMLNLKHPERERRNHGADRENELPHG